MPMSDKKTEILQAAEELFAQKGFDGTSVRDIAQHANVNLAMISYYFGSKEKLLEALIDYRSSYTAGILEELSADQTLSPWDKIDRLLDFYIDKIMSHQAFHKVMTYHYSTTRSKDIRELITTIKLRNLEQIKKILAEGQRKKVFRKVDVELTMTTVMGTISQITMSKGLFCRFLNIEEYDEQTYLKKMIPRLRTHLKELMRAHLEIRNEA
jgi:AcrR family transcriptional regulator